MAKISGFKCNRFLPEANDKVSHQEIEQGRNMYWWMVYQHKTIPWSNRGIGPPPTWLNAWVCFALQRRRAESGGARERGAKQQGEGGRRRGLRNQRRVGRREAVEKAVRERRWWWCSGSAWLGREDRVTINCGGHLVTLADGRAALGTGTRVFLLCHSTPWRRSRMD